MSAGAAPSVPFRRGYLDWLRGLAVMIMIEAHVLDSWTRVDQREAPLFAWSMLTGGFGAPLFLFLAGLSVVLSAGAKARTTGDDRKAASLVVRRGLQIFALAFLFRLQAIVLSWGTWRSILKVDILNVMGLAIMAAAGLWAIGRTARGRLVVFAAATLAVALLTPPARGAALLGGLPDPVEAYLRPVAPYTSFSFLPWLGFVFAGACAGVLIAQTITPEAERRLNWQLSAAGLLLAAGGYAASYLPSLSVHSQFWTSSPSFFLIRTGVLVALIGVAYAWQQRPGGVAAWSPLRQLGRTSLFVYWIHIELVYGLVVRPLHKSLTLGQAWLGVLIVGLLMLIASIAKERIAQSFGPRLRRRWVREPARVVL